MTTCTFLNGKNIIDKQGNVTYCIHSNCKATSKEDRKIRSPFAEDTIKEHIAACNTTTTIMCRKYYYDIYNAKISIKRFYNQCMDGLMQPLANKVHKQGMPHMYSNMHSNMATLLHFVTWPHYSPTIPT